ncbi:MAG: hypothetical protein ACK4F9_02360 [Brevinematia bacterium]
MNKKMVVNVIIFGYVCSGRGGFLYKGPEILCGVFEKIIYNRSVFVLI